MTPTLILYGTDGCHLCDEAELLLRQLGLQWQGVDIVDDETLLERYGTSIPVLARSDSGEELNWPFLRNDVLRLLAS